MHSEKVQSARDRVIEGTSRRFKVPRNKDLAAAVRQEGRRARRKEALQESEGVFLDEPTLESGFELNLRNYKEAQNGSDEDREFLGSFESDNGSDSFFSDQSDDRESDSVSTEDGLNKPESLEAASLSTSDSASDQNKR
jgi:hypothetical protein